MSNTAGKTVPASISATVILACVIAAVTFCYRARQQALAANDLLAQWPCAADAAALCPDVNKGNGRLNRCLRDRQSSLSSGCLEYLEDIDPSNAWDNVCRDEIRTFCSGLRFPLRCLRENASRLSRRCGALVTSYDAATRWRNACAEDAQRLCSQVPVEEGAASPCLAARLPELSISCRIYYQSKAH